ncbi:DUF1353 domain-containing protein [Helicobacter sp. L8]|uniref:DUF1353 domain-containing protein n=1 Tax=Helicobacter sp. L8 TaxID=2316078 RepID=UPI000EACD339|nr:DUF1353 domain-containing protein [Helicobacter sp. L8]
MRSFTQPLLCEIFEDGTFRVVEGFVYEQRVDFVVIESIEVPDGFRARLGLGPRKCAILHAYLCERARSGEISHTYAHKVFLEAMLESKSARFWAYTLYACVRVKSIFKECAWKK